MWQLFPHRESIYPSSPLKLNTIDAMNDDLQRNDDASEGSPPDEQFAALTTGDGDTIVYDRDNPDAWIQSTLAVEIGSCEPDETSA